MNRKSLLALLLAAAMILALAGCASNTTIEAYPDDDLVLDTASEGIDLEAGFAAYEPDTVVFYVNGDPVTWQELYYEIIYYANYLAQQEGTQLSDWNQACTLVTDADGNYYTYGAVVLSNAVTLLVQYHVMYTKLTELGITVSDTVQDYVDSVRQSAIDTNFDGDEQAFDDYLASMYGTRELWDWFNTVDGMYAYDGFDTLYGEMGSNYSDEDTLTYAQGAEDGTWTQYVQLKLIELPAADETADASDEASGETAVTAQALVDEISASWDTEGTFDELYAQYNTNADLDPYTDGWCVYQGDTADEVYNAALAMEVGDVQAVSTGDKDYVVLKVEVEPDAGVYYDSSDGTMYTLRYYAAWQDYSDMINGEDGWLASAETEWADGFENFTIASVF